MKRKQRHPAFVCRCGLNGLALIRELGRRKVPVHALDSVRSVGTFSRHAAFLSCPDPLSREQDLIGFLRECAPRFSLRPVLLPTDDAWALALARHRDVLAGDYILCLPDAETVALLLNKRLFCDWAEKRGFPVPRTWPLSEASAIPESAYPLVAKPVTRTAPGEGSENKQRFEMFCRHRLVLLDRPGQVETFFTTMEKWQPDFMLQEYVPGWSDRMFTIGIYADGSSNLRGVFTGRKLRGYPAEMGDCMLGQSDRVPSVLVDMVGRICRELSIRGIAEFEFKQDAETGKFYLIEINPRSWSWIGIAPACGVSLPWLAYADAVGQEIPACVQSTAAPGEVKWVRLVDDFLNCRWRYPRFNDAAWRPGFRAWLASVSAPRRVEAAFSAEDPLPGMVTAARAVRRLLSGRDP